MQKRKNSGILWLGLILICTLGAMCLLNNNAASTEQESNRPKPEHPENQKPRRIDPLTPPVFQRLNLALPSDQINAGLSQRLDKLMESHPREKVNGTLRHAVYTERLPLSFQNLNTGQATAGVYYSLEDGHATKLWVNPIYLASMSTRRDSIEMWLSLYHESIHYEQTIEGSLYKGENPCEEKLQREIEAYRAECDLAFELHYSDANQGMCPNLREGNGEVFDGWVAHEIKKGVSIIDPRLIDCPDYWDSFARAHGFDPKIPT